MINILVFHKISDRQVDQFEDVLASTLMGVLAERRYHFSTLDELPHAPNAEMRMCLTFDDGNSSDFDFVLPALRKHSARATFFIVTKWLDQPGFLTSVQVRELKYSGMQIGSHSMSHPDFRKLTAAQQIRELVESRKILEDLTGAEITSFAFPYGFKNKPAIAAVLEAGYSYCCTSAHGVLKRPAMVMPRNSIHSGMSTAEVRRVLAARWGMRLAWKLEDAGKAALKSSLPRAYPAIRALLARLQS